MISRPRTCLTGIVQARMQYTCMAESWREAATSPTRVLLPARLPRRGGMGPRIRRTSDTQDSIDDYDETTGIHVDPRGRHRQRILR